MQVIPNRVFTVMGLLILYYIIQFELSRNYPLLESGDQNYFPPLKYVQVQIKKETLICVYSI